MAGLRVVQVDAVSFSLRAFLELAQKAHLRVRPSHDVPPSSLTPRSSVLVCATPQNDYYGELAASMTLEEVRAFIASHESAAQHRTAGSAPDPSLARSDWRVVAACEWQPPSPALSGNAGVKLVRGFVVSLSSGNLLSRGTVIDWLVRGKLASYASFFTLQGVAVATSFPPRLPPAKTTDAAATPQPASRTAGTDGTNAADGDVPCAASTAPPPVRAEAASADAAAAATGGEAWCRRIPGGKADIMTDSSIGLWDKRALGRLFAALVDVAHTSSGGETATHNESMLSAGRALYRPQNKPASAPDKSGAPGGAPDGVSAAEWLVARQPAGAGLTTSTAQLLLLGTAGASHAADVSPGEQAVPADPSARAVGPVAALPAHFAANRLAQQFFSVGRHAPGIAHVVCEYGQAELPQVFCRAAAVSGSIFILRQRTLECEAAEAPAAEAPAAEAPAAEAPAAEAPVAEAPADSPALPPVRFRVVTEHGTARCRAVVASAGHAEPPAEWTVTGTVDPSADTSEQVLVVGQAVAFVESAEPPLPVPPPAGDRAGRAPSSSPAAEPAPAVRVAVVFPPGMVSLPADGGAGGSGSAGGDGRGTAEPFPFAVRVLQGGGGDGTAPATGRHFQLRASCVGAVGPGPGSVLARAREAGRVLAEGAAAVLRAVVSGRGAECLYGAAWATVQAPGGLGVVGGSGVRRAAVAAPSGGSVGGGGEACAAGTPAVVIVPSPGGGGIDPGESAPEGAAWRLASMDAELEAEAAGHVWQRLLRVFGPAVLPTQPFGEVPLEKGGASRSAPEGATGGDSGTASEAQDPPADAAAGVPAESAEAPAAPGSAAAAGSTTHTDDNDNDDLSMDDLASLLS